jgi:hypothetical protein
MIEGRNTRAGLLWPTTYAFIHSFIHSFSHSNDEHGERCHQDIAAMEKRYAGKWSPAILADYYWTVTRDAPELAYKRQAKRNAQYKTTFLQDS